MASMVLMDAPTQHADNSPAGQAIKLPEPADAAHDLVRPDGKHIERGRRRPRRWHRGPSGADLLDLIFKLTSEPEWTATLRNNPSVVLIAKDGDELARLAQELTLAILRHRYPETLKAMRAAGSALPDLPRATIPRPPVTARLRSPRSGASGRAKVAG